MIADGIWYEDFVMVRRGADAIAGHARVLPEEMAAIQQALGDRFPAFVALDGTVHETSVEIGQAARHGDLQTVVSGYRTVQAGCVSCHTAFRVDVREALYSTGAQR